MTVSYLHTNRTKIFILDSIGNKHPQAMKQLNKWLQLEAEDKKSVSNPATALTKLVSVRLIDISLVSYY